MKPDSLTRYDTPPIQHTPPIAVCRGLASLNPMPTFVKATQAYQQGQRTLPGRYYTAADVFAEEQERIFARRWVCVGRETEVANPGDYVRRTVGGESIIVVRGQDG